MATLTKCILCGAQLVNGREWDGEDHVCEADRTPETKPWRCYACGLPTVPWGGEDVCTGICEEGRDDRQREARGEYLGELDEAREDEEP